MTFLLTSLVIMGLVYFLWKWTMARYERMKNDFKNGLNKHSNNPPKGKLSELVQDPTCKLYIAKDHAIEYNGHYFCSEKCKNVYKEGR